MPKVRVLNRLTMLRNDNPTRPLLSLTTPDTDIYNSKEMWAGIEKYQQATIVWLGDVSDFSSERDRKEIERIVHFIYRNRDKDVYVNCDAGMSRSVAVAVFLQDVLGFDYEGSSSVGDNTSFYNRHLYRELVRFWLRIIVPDE